MLQVVLTAGLGALQALEGLALLHLLLLLACLNLLVVEEALGLMTAGLVGSGILGMEQRACLGWLILMLPPSSATAWSAGVMEVRSHFCSY